MSFIYEIIIRAYILGIRISSVWNTKARKWIDGRKNLFTEIEQAIKPGEKIVWFHCASLGEFEQARPVIELFRQRNPGYKIVLTFFSPSGYQVRKNYKGVDYVFYIPADTASNAKRFIELVNPALAVFTKYDYWFNHLRQLQQNNIPIAVFSAVFRKEQFFFQELGNWFLEIIAKINVIFVQDDSSRRLLNKHSIGNVFVCGDTRYDRVLQIAADTERLPLLEKFRNENIPTLVAGSTWEEDERILLQLMLKRKKSMKYIIAPHEIVEKQIRQISIETDLEVLRYSDANEKNIECADIVIIDSVGILALAYRYADVAYVGGGFGNGIHNILEPASFSLPVIFGPNYKKFNEANEMVGLGLAFSIDKFRSLHNKINDFFFEKGKTEPLKRRIKEYMESKKGASEFVVKGLEKLITETK